MPGSTGSRRPGDRRRVRSRWRADAHHVQPRRVRLRRAARRAPAGSCSRTSSRRSSLAAVRVIAGGRRADRPGDHQAADRAVRCAAPRRESLRAAFAELTPREHEVLRARSRAGFPTPEIAAELVLSERDGQDPRQAGAGQARPARPRPGRRARLRDRAGHAGLAAVSAPASSPRALTPSFWKTWRRCVSTVAAVTNSSWAIWRLVRPVAASCATRCSDGVSASVPWQREPARAGAGGEQLGAGAVGERARPRGVRAVHAEPQRLARLARAGSRGAARRRARPARGPARAGAGSVRAARRRAASAWAVAGDEAEALVRGRDGERRPPALRQRQLLAGEVLVAGEDRASVERHGGTARRMSRRR